MFSEIRPEELDLLKDTECEYTKSITSGPQVEAKEENICCNR